jgi:hypothetical protein
VHRFHDVMFRIFGHRYCCAVPSWTAHIGFRWEPCGEGRWNLYNAIWALKARIRLAMR